MTSLLLLAALGGVLAVASPCVLPVLPFVLARTGKSALRDTLPFLAGLMLTFAAAGSIAGAGVLAVASGTASRWIAPVILFISALALMSPTFATRLTRPLVQMGVGLSPTPDDRARPAVALGIGAATGLIWAPCAGPILALVVVGGATGTLSSSQLALVLLSFAAGSGLVFAFILTLRRFCAITHAINLVSLASRRGTDHWCCSDCGRAVDSVGQRRAVVRTCAELTNGGGRARLGA